MSGEQRLRVLGEETAWEGQIASVHVERFRHADGEEVTREGVGHPGAVAIVAHDDEHVWLVRQPREAVGEPALLELPAGKLDVDGEPPLETAKRELAEEIGKAAEQWQRAHVVLVEPRLHRRARPDLPRHRPAPRRARRGRGERAHRDRPLAAGAPGRRDRRVPRRQDAHRAAVAAPQPLGPERRLHVKEGRAGREPRHGNRPGATQRPARSSTLVLDFLAYLEFERGLSRNTLEAYRSDLLQFGTFLRAQGWTRCRRPRRARRLPRRARRRQRRPPARRARDAAAQGRLPALVLPPPAPRGDHRPRPDRRPARAAQEPEAAPGPQPRRGRPAARAAARHRARRAARPRAARAHVRLRAARVGGHRPRGGRRRPRGRRAARARQGLQGAPRADRPRGGRRRAGLCRARPAHAGRRPRRAAAVRQLRGGGADAPGPLQDRPAPRPHGRARRQDEPAHAAPHLRDPSAGRRLRPALGAGDARPRRHRHDPDLHAPVRRAPEGRLLPRPTRGPPVGAEAPVGQRPGPEARPPRIARVGVLPR